MLIPWLLLGSFFFCRIAGLLRPDLTQYQCTNPMITFMNEDVEVMVRRILGEVIKSCTVLSEGKNGVELMKLNLEDPKIFVSTKKLHLGFVTDIEVKRVSQKGKAKDNNVNKFQARNQEFYHCDDERR